MAFFAKVHRGICAFECCPSAQLLGSPVFGHGWPAFWPAMLGGCHRPFGDPVLTRLHQGHGFAIYRYPKQALSAL